MTRPIDFIAFFISVQITNHEVAKECCSYTSHQFSVLYLGLMKAMQAQYSAADSRRVCVQDSALVRHLAYLEGAVAQILQNAVFGVPLIEDVVDSSGPLLPGT